MSVAAPSLPSRRDPAEITSLGPVGMIRSPLEIHILGPGWSIQYATEYRPKLALVGVSRRSPLDVAYIGAVAAIRTLPDIACNWPSNLLVISNLIFTLVLSASSFSQSLFQPRVMKSLIHTREHLKS